MILNLIHLFLVPNPINLAITLMLFIKTAILLVFRVKILVYIQNLSAQNEDDVTSTCNLSRLAYTLSK